MERKRKLFHKLVSVDEAISLLKERKLLEPIGIEEVEIYNSLGRVLAEDIYSQIDYPPFDRSEVDGYAVDHLSVEGADEQNPAVIKVIGKILVGEEPKIDVKIGEGVEIATGAPIPRGANSVVMEEFVNKLNDSTIEVFRSVHSGENIAFAGNDLSKGELALKKGKRIGPGDIGLLASIGIKKIKVYVMPKVAVISTGREITEPGSELTLGKVYDTNGQMITAFIRQIGAHSQFFGIVPDNEKMLGELIDELLKNYDIIVTSGGTSAGAEDIVYRVFEKKGRLLVHGLKLKPGKPTVIAESEKKILVGLPGFPLSSIANAYLLLRPIIEMKMGLESKIYEYEAKITSTFRKDIGKMWIVPVVLSKINNELFAIPILTHSGNVSVISKANGFALMPEEKDVIYEGDRVKVIETLELNRLKDAIILGSHDILLVELLSMAGIYNSVTYITGGSYLGLELVKKGYIDVAPVHLLDEKTGNYNVPFIERDDDLKNRVVLYGGYSRKLVLAHRPEISLSSFEDIIDLGLRFVNRNRGSGTRSFIDIELKKVAAKRGIEFEKLKKSINGYYYEVTTHSGVAAAISQGRADAGVCVELAAKMYGLPYIPLQYEHFDFIVNKKSLNKNAVLTFLSYLSSDVGRKTIDSHYGYKSDEKTGEKVCC